MHFFKKGCKKLIYESSLTEKKIQFLEIIPKTKESIKKKSEKKEYDLAKETVKFLRHNDYACLRDLKILMGFKISRTCFYLTKGGLIRKPNKSELITELKSMITKNIPTHLPPTNHQRNVIINFMLYARKAPIRKKNLKTYNDFFISPWSTFSFLFKSCNRYCFWCAQRKQHQSKWAKTKNNRLSHRNNYFGFWSTFTCGNWWILVCIKEKDSTTTTLHKVGTQQG